MSSKIFEAVNYLFEILKEAKYFTTKTILDSNAVIDYDFKEGLIYLIKETFETLEECKNNFRFIHAEYKNVKKIYNVAFNKKAVSTKKSVRKVSKPAIIKLEITQTQEFEVSNTQEFEVSNTQEFEVSNTQEFEDEIQEQEETIKLNLSNSSDEEHYSSTVYSENESIEEDLSFNITQDYEKSEIEILNKYFDEVSDYIYDNNYFCESDSACNNAFNLITNYRIVLNMYSFNNIFTLYNTYFYYDLIKKSKFILNAYKLYNKYLSFEYYFDIERRKYNSNSIKLEYYIDEKWAQTYEQNSKYSLISIINCHCYFDDIHNININNNDQLKYFFKNLLIMIYNEFSKYYETLFCVEIFYHIMHLRFDSLEALAFNILEFYIMLEIAINREKDEEFMKNKDLMTYMIKKSDFLIYKNFDIIKFIKEFRDYELKEIKDMFTQMLMFHYDSKNNHKVDIYRNYSDIEDYSAPNISSSSDSEVEINVETPKVLNSDELKQRFKLISDELHKEKFISSNVYEIRNKFIDKYDSTYTDDEEYDFKEYQKIIGLFINEYSAECETLK